MPPRVNHLATAVVSTYVLEPLDNTFKSVGKPGRLAIVSSENHFWTKFREQSSPSILEDKSNIERCRTSKLLNVFWMRELNKLRLDVVINTVNPDFCDSSLYRSDDTARSAAKLLALSSRMRLPVMPWTAAWTSVNSKLRTPLVLSQNGAQLQRKLWKETVTLLRNEAAPAEILEKLDKE